LRALGSLGRDAQNDPAPRSWCADRARAPHRRHAFLLAAPARASEAESGALPFCAGQRRAAFEVRNPSAAGLVRCHAPTQGRERFEFRIGGEGSPPAVLEDDRLFGCADGAVRAPWLVTPRPALRAAWQLHGTLSF
jgi:hypothetical protein